MYKLKHCSVSHSLHLKRKHSCIIYGLHCWESIKSLQIITPRKNHLVLWQIYEPITSLQCQTIVSPLFCRKMKYLPGGRSTNEKCPEIFVGGNGHFGEKYCAKLTLNLCGCLEFILNLEDKRLTFKSQGIVMKMSLPAIKEALAVLIAADAEREIWEIRRYF